MSITKYNKNRLPSLFDDFFNDWSIFDETPAKGLSHYVPLGDVIETDESFKLEIMLPGFDKKEINMKIEEDSLIITAERKKTEEKYNRIESRFGSFKKSYSLPNYVDTEKINAKYVNGVLNIEIPKIEEKSNVKLIEIK